MKSPFKVRNEFKPAGDQPKAIEALVKGVEEGMRHQTLFGVTGSGKTFTVANVIAAVGKPTLVIAHNKTLAAQLAQEYREFFPNNSVHYFVSYYDYYQPEAYMPVTDTYIEKEAMINEEIERLRHASTQALLTRKDVIIVASVSCIYGLGSPVEYEKVNLKISAGMKANRAELVRRLVGIHFERTTADLEPGLFRAIGNTIEIMPVNEKVIYRLSFEGEAIGQIDLIDSTTRSIIKPVDALFLFPAKHFITDKEQSERAFKTIKAELDARLKELEKAGKNLEAERLKRRTSYDLAMIREVGYTNGIENYSRHFSGHAPGEPPDTLLSYFPHKPDGTADFLTIIDESHVTVPQLNGMYAGDQSRKKTLIEHGFRLPSAADNRPLKFDEFEERIGQTIYTTATPGAFEKEKSSQIVEQVIRPTGLIDPVVVLKPVVEKGTFKGQIADSIEEAEKTIKKGFRVIMTTLTKKMAEDLTDYLKEKNIKTEYLHSDVKTIDRIDILTKFRRGEFDVVVGVNLLREGLDLPEVALICILDADKEGFLRSETALIQIIGRAARNIEGKVIIYADVMTGSIDRAVKETNRRRAVQIAYNEKHGITPKTIIKKIQDITDQMQTEHKKAVNAELEMDREMFEKDPKALMRKKESEMNAAVKVLDFETAALLRDEIAALYAKLAPAEQAKPKAKKGKRGFTLIELLVVISIIGLLSSIVLASLNSARTKGSVGAGRQFESNVYHAEADQAIGIWDFTEGSGAAVADRTGNGNNGTIVGGVTWSTDVPSGTGNSLLFDGATGYITIPDSPSVEITGDLTISMWVKPGSTQLTYADIVSKHGSGGYVIEQNVSNTNRFCLSWDTTGAGGWTPGAAVCTTLTPNIWQQFTVVKSGATVTHYINGAVVASGTGSSANISVNNLALRIGSFSSSGGRNFNGYLDQVRIFNKALVASDVRAIYAAGAAQHGLALRP